ncbi:class I SAM-dependent methyltransferase [uncultured Oscillibacter sp.]|uniref:class I SAM-dependent methyltransferase n=1 Tax=uncultured Oscillibacter sp. TaxID=876091 RepID=UPI0025ED2674|nr:class I SAM-dependent methyltransferase [uncultured Oscillibacter sp.]
MNTPDTNYLRFWQRVAKLYAPFMKSSGPLYDRITRRCLPYLSADMAVLELACGSGQLTFRLANRVERWEATDFSDKMVAEAQKHASLPNLTFTVQDATALSYPDSSFDAVLIANALHIMPEPDKALSEIRRVLKPGGLLLAPTFVWAGNSGHRFRAKLMDLAGFKVLHRWNAAAFSKFVEQRGFSTLERDVLPGGVSPLCCLIARKL